VGGQEFCLVVASVSACWWPAELPWMSAMEGFDASAAGGLGEGDAVACGDDEVGVVEEPVDGGVGERFGHQLIEPGRMQVRGQGDAPFLVGGVHDPVEGFGGVGRNREQPDVVDADAGIDRPMPTPRLCRPGGGGEPGGLMTAGLSGLFPRAGPA